MNILRRIPDREIIYLMRYKDTAKEYHGRLVDIRWDKQSKQVRGDIQLESNDWGVLYPHSDIPYGKDKLGCWFFKHPHPETSKVMGELGHEMTAYDMLPGWKIPEKPSEELEAKEEKLDPAFVQAAVQEGLEKHRNHDNGGETAAGAKAAGISRQPKAAAKA